MKALLALVLSLGSGLAIADQNFGHWSVGVTDDKSMAYAATANSDGSIFGEYCQFSEKSCQWRLVTQTSCTTGSDIPVLANTDKGAISLALTCMGAVKDGWYQAKFKDWQAVEALAKDGAIIGFAMPLQSDQFTVQHFELDGLNTSTRSLETEVTNLPERKPKSFRSVSSSVAEYL